MSLTLRFAAGSDVGLIREGNEDSAYAGPWLLAVADGMGGAAAGEVASSVAIARLADLDDDVPGADLLDLLRTTVESANDELHEMVGDNAALDGMGTTLTALLWEGGRLGVAHVGDSRGYLFRSGQLHRITHDHTFVQSLVDEGRLTTDEASSHPQRSLLTRVLDGHGEPELDLSVREALPGDRYLLCSDGLTAVVSEDTIAEALAIPDPQPAVDRLIELALRGGAPDNVTCVVADVVDDEIADAAPVVVGAAASRPHRRRTPTDSAAGRAALARHRHRGEPDAPAPTTHRRRRRWLRGIALVVLGMLVLGGVATGGWAYVRTQYYIGSDGGNVAVYRGVAGSVAGVALHSLHQRTDIPVAVLPAFERDRIGDGITAHSLDGANRIVARLRGEICPTPSPTPRPTAAPHPSPAKSGAASGHHRATSAPSHAATHAATHAAARPSAGPSSSGGTTAAVCSGATP